MRNILKIVLVSSALMAAVPLTASAKDRIVPATLHHAVNGAAASVPELDPGAAGGAIALIVSGLFVVATSRRRRWPLAGL